MITSLLLPLTSEQVAILTTFCTRSAEIDLLPQENEDSTFSVTLSNPEAAAAEGIEETSFPTEEAADAFIDLCLAELPAFTGRPRPYLLKSDCRWKSGFAPKQFDSLEEAEDEAGAWASEIVRQSYGDQQKIGGLQAAWIDNPEVVAVSSPRNAEWDRQLFEAAAAWSKEQNRYPEDEAASGAWLPISDLREACEATFTLIHVTTEPDPFNPESMAGLTYLTPSLAADLLRRKPSAVQLPEGTNKFALDSNGTIYCYRVELEGQAFALAVGERFTAEGRRMPLEVPLFDRFARKCGIEASALIRHTQNGFHVVDEEGTGEFMTAGAAYPTEREAVIVAAKFGFTFAVASVGLIDLETLEVLDACTFESVGQYALAAA